MALTVGLLIAQVVGHDCEDGSSVCATKSRAGSTMLQSQTDVKLDALTTEVGAEKTTLKQRLAAKPLVGKVAALEEEVGTLLSQVKELQTKVGIPTSSSEDGTGVEPSLVQRANTSDIKHAIQEAPHSASSSTSNSEASLIDATQSSAFEEDPLSTDGGPL